MTVCTRCKADKPDSEFSKEPRKANGLNSHCKKCKAEARKKWYGPSIVEQLQQQITTLTRQRDLAVEAIRHCIAAMGSVTDVKKAMDWPQLHNAQMLSLQALDAIKESEAK